MAHVSVPDEVIALADLLRPWRGRFSVRRSELIARLIPSAIYLAGVYMVSGVPGSSLPVLVDDRLAHFFEYFVLAWLLMLVKFPDDREARLPSSAAPAASRTLNSPRATLVLWLFGAVFAVTDEFHQSFIPGRDVSSRDLAFDLLGLTAGFALVWFMIRGSEPAR